MYEEAPVICRGESTTLTAPDAGGNFTYQWTRLDPLFGDEDLGTNRSIVVSPTADTNIYQIVMSPGIGCDVTLFDTVFVIDPLIVSNVVETCIGDNTYQIDFLISEGDPDTYAVIGSHTGTLTGTGAVRAFTSDPIAINAPYNFSVTDGGGCESFDLDGVSTCPVFCDVWPMVNAGADALLCLDSGSGYTIGDAQAIDAVDFLPLTDPSKAGLLWTTTGVGILTDETTVSPTYVPDPSETGQTIELILTGFSGETDQTFCPDVSDTMEITISTPATSEAGSDALICEGDTYQITDAVVTFNDSLLWSHTGNGTLDDSRIINPVYTPGASDIGSTVTLTLTSYGIAPCLTVTDTMQIEITPQPIVEAGDAAEVCSDGTHTITGISSSNAVNLTWTHDGNGTLDQTDPILPVYTPDVSDGGNQVTLTLTGTANTPCVDAIDQVILTIIPPPTAEAGDPLSTCAAPVTLTGSAINADSISWTHNGSGTIADDNTATPTYTPGVLDQGTTITLTMTAHGIAPCGNVQDSVEIIVVGGATAFAGDDAIICQDSTIAVQDVYATDYDQLIWSIITGNGTLDQSDPMAPIYTPAATDAGTTVSLELLAEVADPCTDDRDTVEIIIIGLPTANAGDDGLICQTETYTITGSDTTNASNIFWTHNGTGTLDDITTISPTYTPSPADAGTTVTLTLNVEAISPCGGITDEVDLEISPLALANAGNPSQICANEVYPLTGSATGTAYNWTHDGIGVLANPTTLTPDYTPTTAEIGNTITFTLSVTGIAPCPDTSDQVTLNIIPAPEVEAGDDTEICAGDNHTITGADTTNSTTIEWTHNGLGTIQNPGTLTPTYISSVAEAGNSVTLTLTVYPKAPCVQPIEDQLTITILSPPTADAGDRQTVCAGETVSLTNASATNQSSVNWTHDGQGTITNPTTLSPTYTPAATEAGTSVKLTLTANGNGSCLEDTDETTIRIVGPPQVTVGAMNTICYGEDYRLLGATQSNTAYVEWSHNGQGTLDDINALEPTYTAHTNDQGTAVSFTLTGYPMYPCSGTVEAQTLVRIIPKPIVEAGDNGIICANGGTHTMTGASVDHYSNFNWELIGGNPNNLSDQTTLTPSYSPSISEGNTQIQLVLTAEPNQPCTDPARDTITLNIEVVPEFTVTPGAVCPGGTVTMDIVPINTFTVDLFDWYAHPTGGTIVHTGNNYTTAPLYDSITYYVEPSRGCIGERVQVDLVVYPVPRASYSIAPSEIIDMVHTTTFTDNSTGGTTGSWDTGDSILTYTAVPTFDYTYQLEVGNIPEEVNTGLYIENQYGCKDSAYLVIPVDIKWAFYVPNAFTPGDQNQINDEFFGEGYGIVEKKMWIFNRWGDNIFYSDELTGTWDGYDHMYANGKSPIQTSPDQVKEDTYVYKIEIINVYGEKHTYIGGVNLIR